MTEVPDTSQGCLVRANTANGTMGVHAIASSILVGDISDYSRDQGRAAGVIKNSSESSDDGNHFEDSMEQGNARVGEENCDIDQKTANDGRLRKVNLAIKPCGRSQTDFMDDVMPDAFHKVRLSTCICLKGILLRLILYFSIMARSPMWHLLTERFALCKGLKRVIAAVRIIMAM